jgi:hypothetical protein
VNKQDLIRLIEEKGWKNISQDSDYLGHRFDVIGERKYRLSMWHLLVDFVGNLDKENFEEVKKVFADTSKKSESWLWGECFLFCAIAERIETQIVEDIRKDSSWGLPLSFVTKRDRFIWIFSAMLVYIFAAISATFSIWKKIDWAMVFAYIYWPLCGTTIIGLFSESLKGGGGKIFLLDLNEKKTYEKAATIRFELNKFSKEMNKILQKLT